MKPLRPFVLLCAIVLASGTPVPPNVPIKERLIDPVSRNHPGSQVPTAGATENPPRPGHMSHDESVIVVASPYKRKAQDPTAEGLPPKRFRNILSAPTGDHPGSQVLPAATIEIPPRLVHKSHDQSVIAVTTTGPSDMRKAQDPTAESLPLQASGNILSPQRGHPEPQVPRAATTEIPPNPGHESREQSVVVVATTGPSPKRITEAPAAEDAARELEQRISTPSAIVQVIAIGFLI
ncbi:hypothetical protein H0H93_011183 [Arthromyces matolae]|nr:hypothetical protein H0H93_011183 [Arthromyces matolae]